MGYEEHIQLLPGLVMEMNWFPACCEQQGPKTFLLTGKHTFDNTTQVLISATLHGQDSVEGEGGGLWLPERSLTCCTDPENEAQVTME